MSYRRARLCRRNAHGRAIIRQSPQFTSGLGLVPLSSGDVAFLGQHGQLVSPDVLLTAVAGVTKEAVVHVPLPPRGARLT